MGMQYPEITDQHIEFIKQQKIFFVGTAADTGSVNVSPKGMDSLKVINNKQVAWLNLTGSGNETSAHVQINPRMTIMFCAFEGRPLILRLYGKAEVIHPADARWNDYISLFPTTPGSRQIFILNIDSTLSSCGTAVPLYDYAEDRDGLMQLTEKQGPEGIKKYWLLKNQQSMDGFPTNIAKLSGIEKK